MLFRNVSAGMLMDTCTFNIVSQQTPIHTYSHTFERTTLGYRDIFRVYN